MRIGLAARWLELPPCGPREYTENLIRALLQFDQRNEYVVFHSAAAYLGTFPRATEILLPSQNKLWWDYVLVPRAIARQQLDVFWTPSYIVPFSVRCKSIATVLDLAYFTLPQAYRRADVLYMRAAMRGSFRRAAALLAVSDYTRRDIVRLFPFAAEKTVITYAAAASQYHRDLNPNWVATVRQIYDLPASFVFYAGSISPRKGLPYLMEAFALLKRQWHLNCQLVLTGGWQWGRSDVRQLIARLDLEGDVRTLGHVPAEHMPALYALADLFVYPSLYEGFGLPVLEAMACGCPVVCSNLTSLPEVAGEAALLVDPRDVQVLAEALRRGLTDRVLRGDLVARGLAQAAAFNWETTACKTLNVIERVGRDGAPA